MTDKRSRRGPRRRATPPIEVLGLALRQFEELELLVQNGSGRKGIVSCLREIDAIFRSGGLDAISLTPSRGADFANVRFVIDEPRFGFFFDTPYGYQDVLEFLRTTCAVLCTAADLSEVDSPRPEEDDDTLLGWEDDDWSPVNTESVTFEERDIVYDRYTSMEESLHLESEVTSDPLDMAMIMSELEDVQGVRSTSPIGTSTDIVDVDGSCFAARDVPRLGHDIDTLGVSVAPPDSGGEESVPDHRLATCRALNQSNVWRAPRRTLELLSNFRRSFPMKIGNSNVKDTLTLEYLARGILLGWATIGRSDPSLPAEDYVLRRGKIRLRAGFFYWLLANSL